ncbi:hypothetical protein H4R33_004957 [Dimargaris cristalligena]|nr:hypothetical protein H4R33_004957 [Dimargaris cristalligena]
MNPPPSGSAEPNRWTLAAAHPRKHSKAPLTRRTTAPSPTMPAAVTSGSTTTTPFPSSLDVTRAQLGRLPKVKCAICLEAPDPATFTACGHIFCETCILVALQTINQCPVCRKALNRRLLRILQFPVVPLRVSDTKPAVASLQPPALPPTTIALPLTIASNSSSSVSATVVTSSGLPTSTPTVLPRPSPKRKAPPPEAQASESEGSRENKSSNPRQSSRRLANPALQRSTGTADAALTVQRDSIPIPGLANPTRASSDTQPPAAISLPSLRQSRIRRTRHNPDQPDRPREPLVPSDEAVPSTLPSSDDGLPSIDINGHSSEDNSTGLLEPTNILAPSPDPSAHPESDTGDTQTTLVPNSFNEFTFDFEDLGDINYQAIFEPDEGDGSPTKRRRFY